MRKNKGQSILEYTLLITAVVLVLVWGVGRIGGASRAHITTTETMLNAANTELATATTP